MSVPATFDATWSAVPDNVAVARRTVFAHLAQADTPDPPLNDIALAISEAATNVVNHAYAGREPGPLRVCVELDAEEIEVVVEDQGSGMVPRPDSPGLGLGMPLIATLADRFDVRTQTDGGTRLCMWFKKNPSSAVLPA